MLWKITAVAATFLILAGCRTKRPVPVETTAPAQEEPVLLQPEAEDQLPQAIAPKEFPRVPDPDAAAAQVPDGYQVEVVVRDLTYPTSVEFDDRGNMYVAEAGFSYGDPVGPARIMRVSPEGEFAIVADQLTGPLTDILWHEGRLYVAQWGKVSVLEPGGGVRDLVTDLPVSWDHHNNQLTIGPDGKLYFGVGSATNSGVVGLDNISPYLWLLFYPDIHDIPAQDVELTDVSYTTPDALTVMARKGDLVSFSDAVKHLLWAENPLLVETGAFQPFGRKASTVPGRIKANSTVLRMNLDGSDLEVFAWGFRNPFGLAWSPDGNLYAADNGYDERGSRPIANAPDVLWLVRQGAYYGFPDFAAGMPVTEERFHSSRGPEPRFLLANHPPVEKPVLMRPPHAGVTKLDFSTNEQFGFDGQLFLAEVGSGAPVTTSEEEPSGHRIVRIDLESGEVASFFSARQESLGPDGQEYSATSAPKRPVDARFSPDGTALYVVDFGALTGFPAGGGPLARPFPNSGAVWRITRAGVDHDGPPSDLSPLPPRQPAY